MVAAYTSAGCAVAPGIRALPTAPACRTVISSRPIALEWFGPTEPRDRERLDAWCSVVGPILVAGPAGASPIVADELAIVTWNVQVGSGDVRELVARLRRGEFTAGRPVRHFALLLQEARRVSPAVPALAAGAAGVPRLIGRGDARSIDEVAGELGLSLVFAPSMRNGPGHEDRGSAILSTVPPADLQIVELPFERQRRVAVSAAFAGETSGGEGWRVRLVSVHFDTGLALTRGGPAASRRRQAQALAGALRDATPPLVIGGDLNTWWGEDEPAVRDLRRQFPDARRPPAWTTWSGPLGAGTQLDHLFARLPRGALEVRRLDDRMGSDHHPLLTLVNTRHLSRGSTTGPG